MFGPPILIDEGVLIKKEDDGSIMKVELVDVEDDGFIVTVELVDVEDDGFIVCVAGMIISINWHILHLIPTLSLK